MREQISVILADDDEIDRYVAKRVLTKHEQIDVVSECADGVELLELLQSSDFQDTRTPSSPPVLILLDINMPRMSGFDVLRHLADAVPSESVPNETGPIETGVVAVDRRTTQDQTCVVLMLTSSVSMRDRQEAASFPLVAGYLEKPLDNVKLTAALLDLYPTLMPPIADN